MHQSLLPRERFVALRGSTIKTLEAGQGPAVLFGHSYLWNAEAWTPQFRALAAEYRLIAPDLWGHGGSGPMPTGTNTMRDLARHHLELMDALGIETFSIVGHSIGGMWGAELALMAPERVDGLVLIGTYLGPEPAQTRARFLAMLAAVEVDAALPAGMADALIPLFFHPDSPIRMADLVESFKQRLESWPRDRLADSVVALGRLFVERRDALDELRFLKMPALVMTGSHDWARPVAEGRAMAAMIGCEFHELPGSGHMAMLEKPLRGSQILLSFLRALDKRGIRGRIRRLG